MKWSQAEISFLKENYQSLSLKKLKNSLNRSTLAIRNKAFSLSLKSKKLISPGDIFNRLTVIEETKEKTKSGHRIFICKCICGNFKKIDQTSLKSGSTTSCGCYNKERSSLAHQKSPGFHTWSYLYGQYKNNKNSKRYGFLLTREQFQEIASKNCFYCGIQPRDYNVYNFMRKGTYTDHAKNRNWVKANGIDRIDSIVGYNLSNTTPCCEICNNAKSDFSKKEFNNWLDRITDFRIKQRTKPTQRKKPKKRMMPL